MLDRQYGIAASSSIVKFAHNEGMQGRNRNLPPNLVSDTVGDKPTRLKLMVIDQLHMGPKLGTTTSFQPYRNEFI